ncbi:MAG: tetratricopeptide repeat protein [Myxococcaceae bacterium]
MTVFYFPKGGPAKPVRKGPRTVTEQVAVTLAADGESLPRPTPQVSLDKAREGERTEEVVLPEAILQQMVKKKKTNEQALDMAMMGHQLFEAGRIDEARVIFEGLVATHAKDAFPYTMLGTIYLAQGELDRASKLFSAALVLDPADSAAAVYKAEIRLHRGNSRSAVATLVRVAKGDKADPFVRRARKLLKLLEPKAK